MRRENEPLRLKLTAAATIDYPSASEILVSFPDDWELVGQIIRGDTPLYIAAMPEEQERPRRDQFYGLSPEINLEMTAYRLYKFFQPWPTPSVIVSWNEAAQIGRVEAIGKLRVHLREIGQAQTWFGTNFGVLWEGYFYESGRGPNWQTGLAAIWRVIEKDMGVAKIFTQPHDPAFKEGYQIFLSGLSYGPDPSAPRWWSKTMT